MPKPLTTPAGEMPFLDHLEELRWRMIWSLVAVTLCAAAGWFLVTRLDVLGLLVEPIKPFLHGTKLKYLSPTEPFFITLKLAVSSDGMSVFYVRRIRDSWDLMLIENFR